MVTTYDYENMVSNILLFYCMKEKLSSRKRMTFPGSPTFMQLAEAVIVLFNILKYNHGVESSGRHNDLLSPTCQPVCY